MVRRIACALLLCAGCSSTSEMPAIGAPAAPSGNTAAGTGASTTPPTSPSKTQSAGSGASGGSPAPHQPATAGSGGSATAASGGGGMSGAAGDAATAGAAAGIGAGGAAGLAANGGSGGGAAAAFKMGCTSGDVGPCGSFIPDSGKELMLGPYGAMMDLNVGKGFEYPVASGDSDDNSYCNGFTSSFGEDQKSTDMLLDLTGLDMSLYTVYRPAQFPEGKIPIITWGNGTCAKPEGYGTLLRYVASQGFFIVAANSRFVGDGSQMKKGIDFALAANDDMNSPYYQKLDTTKIGAMGHSQGGMGTLAVVSDQRVQAVIIWNAAASTSKPFLAVSGDSDVVGLTADSMRSAVMSAKVKGAFLYYHMVPMTGSASGHLTLMTQPERVVEPAVAFWKYILNGDTESQKYFAGTDCKLCNRADEFDFGQHGMD
jgi:hypothetical protein